MEVPLNCSGGTIESINSMNMLPNSFESR
uniref:Uncharacterized protein n=1 Tax=Rhizophora mucronata TaxID=61149 RepID=A0A2P2JGH7_RHIMU